jgi:hypothetical protein
MSHWRSQQRSQVMMSADTVKMTARTEARYGVTEQHNKTGGVLPPFRALTGSAAGDDRNKAPIRVAGALQYSSRFCGQMRSVDKPVGPVRLRVEIAIVVHRSAPLNFPTVSDRDDSPYLIIISKRTHMDKDRSSAPHTVTRTVWIWKPLQGYFSCKQKHLPLL